MLLGNLIYSQESFVHTEVDILMKILYSHRNSMFSEKIYFVLEKNLIYSQKIQYSNRKYDIFHAKFDVCIQNLTILEKLSVVIKIFVFCRNLIFSEKIRIFRENRNFQEKKIRIFRENQIFPLESRYLHRELHIFIQNYIFSYELRYFSQEK